MEKRDFLQHPIQYPGLHRIDGPNQLSRGLGAQLSRGRTLATPRIVLEYTEKDETTFLGIAGVVVLWGRIGRIHDNYKIARIKLDPETGDAIYGGGSALNGATQRSEPLPGTMGYTAVGGRTRRAAETTTTYSKWGGLNGCTFDDAQSWCKIAKDTLMSTVYRQRPNRIAAHCRSVATIQ